MTVKITLHPSGHEFQAEPTETLLDCALRSGISLDYNCNNGSCGKCAARVISGRIGEVLPHDYVFKEHEKDPCRILLCRTKALSDMVIEANEAHGVNEIPLQRIETTVHKIESPDPDIHIVQLKTPRSNTLRFLAGQHVALQIDTLPVRNKSIASCPCNGMYLQFHIQKSPGDEFSEYVFSQLKPKEKVMVEGPYGDFTLDDDSMRPIIFIAFETGMAPIKSLIEHAIALEHEQPIYLYWLVDQDNPHYIDNYCRSWVDALDNFSYDAMKINYTNGDIVDIDRLEQELTRTAGLILDKHDDIDQYDLYVNGPAWLFSGMKSVFMQGGIPEAQIRIDSMKRY